MPGVLATLNYDNLLEEATGRRTVTWLESNEVQRVLMDSSDSAVLHLHGSFQHPESVVLGASSYLSIKSHSHTKAVLQLMTMDRTLLFIGCGDTVLDPNFAQLIDWGAEALNDVVPRHYLLCRSSEVANFQGKLTNAPWLQPLSYGNDYCDLIPFLRELCPLGGSSTIKTRPRSIDFDVTAYRQSMCKRYGKLKLEELDPTSHDLKPLMLTGMFVTQNARECVKFLPRVFELPKETQRVLSSVGDIDAKEDDDDAVQEDRKAYFNQVPRSILEVIQDPALTRIVVLGDPGSGKSSLLQYLLLIWAEKSASAAPTEGLPILIELREYARARQERQVSGFLEYLHSATNVRWHFDREQLDDWLRTNVCLICFDGVDEVFDRVMRDEVSTEIHRFSDEYPILHRLEGLGFLSSERKVVGGRSRIVYRVTKIGMKRLEESLTDWKGVIAAVNSVLQGGSNDAPALA